MPQTPTEWLGRTQVNSISTGFQGHQEIIGLSNGNILVVFSDDSETAPGLGRDIVGVIYDAEGDVVQAEVQLNTAFFFDGEEWPSIAATNDGGFIMVYEDSDASGTSIRGQRYSDQGDSIFTATVLEDPGDVLLSNPQVAVNLDDNSFFVTYEYDDGGDNTIRGRLFDSNMDPLDVERILRSDEDPTNSQLGGDPLRQDTVALTGGGFVTVFEEGDIFNSATDQGIEYVLSDASGVNVVNGSVTIADGIQDASARVAALPDGGFVVTWMQAEVTDGVSNNNILYRVYDASGVTRTGILTAADSLNNHFSPAVIGLEDGTFFIAWEDNSAGRLEGQLFSAADGSSIGSEINIETSGSPINVELGTTTDGRILISYVTLADGDVQFEIFDPRDATIIADLGDGQVTARLGGSTIIGSAWSDILLGQGGNDTFVFAEASTSQFNIDTIDGGSGINTFEISVLTDQRIVDLQAGVFALGNISATSDTRATLANIANVTIAGAQDVRGNNSNNVLTAVGDFANHFQGLGGTDTMSAGAGNDVLDGGAGSDTMDGGAGNDSYIVDNAGDQTIEQVDGGTDTVRSWISWALAGNVERLQLLGGANNSATGNGLDNELFGNTGNNVLNGSVGADRMEGFGGNDSYIVDNAGDQTIEAVAGGTDTVRSWISWALADNVERLQLLGGANNSATGNGLDNELFGNTGNNVLNGSVGADRMEGFGGNDSYIVDNAGDQTIEAIGGGTDTVRSWISWTLADNVERLQLLGGANNNATGNGLDNELFGNAGNNALNGRGGADRMEGFAGNDSYFVDNSGDQVIEAVGGGIDTVRAWTTWTLGANLERLQLLGTTQPLNGAGNELNNEIFGNAGNNRLAGWDGNDTVTGGAGMDIFIFNTALDAVTNVDTITDFSVADDTIRLDDAIFTAIGPVGTLAAAAFTIGAAATTAAHRIVYNSATGALIYDSNGSAAGGATQFAVLGTGLALTNADFLIA